MSKLEDFPNTRPSRRTPWWNKIPLQIRPADQKYPGAERASDRETLANVPGATPYPGSAAPDRPIQRAPTTPVESRLRRDR